MVDCNNCVREFCCSNLQTINDQFVLTTASELSTVDDFSSRATVRLAKTSKSRRLHAFVSRHRDNRSEGSRLPDGQVGQDFGVELDVAPVQGLSHVPRVVAVLGRGGVNSYRKCKKTSLSSYGKNNKFQTSIFTSNGEPSPRRYWSRMISYIVLIRYGNYCLDINGPAFYPGLIIPPRVDGSPIGHLTKLNC